MGAQVPGDREAVERELGASDTVLRVSGEVRRVLYTTNAVESLHMNLRKIITTRGSFPNEEAAMKLLYLALEKCSTLWPVGFLAGWPRWFSFYLCNFPFQL